MIVVESGGKPISGSYELSITKQIKLLINDLLQKQPIIEIDVKPSAIPVEHKIKAAKIHNDLLKKAKLKSLEAKATLKKLKVSRSLEQKNKYLVRLKALEKELKKLKELLDRYEKICNGRVVFVSGKILRKVTPDKEAVGLLFEPDFLQLLIQFAISH